MAAAKVRRVFCGVTIAQLIFEGPSLPHDNRRHGTPLHVSVSGSDRLTLLDQSDKYGRIAAAHAHRRAQSAIGAADRLSRRYRLARESNNSRPGVSTRVR